MDITIVRGKKAWYALVFPFICFCIALAILWNGYETMMSNKNIDLVGLVLGWSFGAGIFVVLGTVFGMVQDYYFDFNRKRYKIVKRVGVLGFGKWHSFKQLEYVSVFENPDGAFEINIWYNSNKHFFVDSFVKSASAIKFASKVANKLNIELHNAINNVHQHSGENDVAASISKEDRKIDAYFSHGNRPLWQTIIAALCFASALGLVYSFVMGLDFVHKRGKWPLQIFEIVAILISAGVRFSIVNDYLFDLQHDQFKIIHNVGPIRWGKWRALKSVDYISVFQKNEGYFLINLWYNTNKHITLTASDDYSKGMEVGAKIAKQLNIALLDASNPRDSQWVDMTK
ncbi:hypothetical protein G5B37_08300 [Rasiella rasia]|uniref:Uncharacterized protein n=1 Tax=Rasiella rasia TaxID=2744027 RepID=A0A6G6GPC2_9FLAO|nr:hypothetical protein [Rasiella rasia]QIE59561.1 hypothetical protein G5B37_08300 [Rasiella rasia]